MVELIDQIFVRAKSEVVALFPDSLQLFVSVFLSLAPILAVFPALFALTTWVERKVLGRIQNRLGPNRVGPFGLLQPLADGLKMLTKEDIVPRSADALIHFIAPLALLVPVLLSFAVLPFGRNMVPLETTSGLLFFFAVGSAAELAVFMAGWSSRNKYSVLGALRAIAQMISYELPLILSTLGVVMTAGSLSLTGVVESQSPVGHLLPAWHVFTPWGIAAFLVFLVCAAAESNRPPFDLPEAESELIAGYLTEYSGFKYALFFLGEYLGLFAISSLGVTLFLGGWQAPWQFLAWVPSYLWFFGKLAGIIGLFIWARGTLPRLRMDQLLGLSWKFLVPLSFMVLISAMFWIRSSGWSFSGALWVRWAGGLLLVGLPYLLLGRALLSAGKRGVRTYRLVDG